MSEPMTPERLTELRERRDRIRKQPYADYGHSYEEQTADAVDELDRLMAALTRIARMDPEGDLGFFAYQTLYPEAAS